MVVGEGEGATEANINSWRINSCRPRSEQNAKFHAERFQISE
jgi:hypothetical protein